MKVFLVILCYIHIGTFPFVTQTTNDFLVRFKKILQMLLHQAVKLAALNFMNIKLKIKHPFQSTYFFCFFKARFLALSAFARSTSSIRPFSVTSNLSRYLPNAKRV